MAGLSALALFGFLFMDWFGVLGVEGAYFNRAVGAPASAGVFSYAHGGVSGWDYLGWLTLALCVLAIVAGLALPVVFVAYESPVLPVVAGIVATLLGGLAMIAIVVENIAQPDGAIVLSGWWLGLLAAAGIARGGFLSIREEWVPGVPMPDVPVRPAPVA